MMMMIILNAFFYFLEPLKNTDDELIKAVRVLIIFAHLKEF